MDGKVRAPDSEAAFSDFVRAERVRFVFIQSPLPILLSPIAAFVLVAALWHVAERRVLLTWAAGTAALALLRLLMVRAYPKQAPEPDKLRAWERVFVITILIVATWWGIGGLFLLVEPLTERLLVFCFLMLMTAGSAASYAAHPATVTASVITLALPVTITFALKDDVVHRALAFAAVLYLAATFRSIKTLTYFFARTHRLAHELERERDRANKLARTDELTGLNNRRAFYEHCETTLRQAKRYAHPVSLLLADVDHFKSVNDAFGHAAGDEVLRVVAQLIREHHRATDVSGRLGGEEFAVLLTETPLSEALLTAERLRSVVGAHALHREGGTIRFTLSVGVTSLEPGQTLDQLIANADAALYDAKRAGRNRVASSAPPPSREDSAQTNAE